MSDGLDKMDLKILRELQKDASRSAGEIADAVGLTQSPCWRRIRRLKEEGYITHIVAILNRHKLNLGAQFFVHVKTVKSDPETIGGFFHAIRAYPEVLECHVTLGSFDFLLRVVTKDMRAYEKFYFEKLSCIPYVREVHSVAALSEIKSTLVLPLAR